MEQFAWPVRVYYEDTDAGNAVYHANYLKYLERARSERLRKAGIELPDLLARHNMLLVISRAEMQFKQIAGLADCLLVTANIGNASRVAMDFEQTIYKTDQRLFNQAMKNPMVSADDFGAIVVQAKVTVVCMDNDKRKPMRMNDAVLKEILGEY
ncbi:MAG: YbgC/FadM family acyl-CoA thioesterase [Gammaproteobacteria bacterium]|nr:YbgC/FadM family acyl-CoA thioesterase [Gammaproteobacteria bacterium]MDH5727474.1 YbgC/FadM family acyl-CoA thioesterase [Gammaproteobacteria bacterium]